MVEIVGDKFRDHLRVDPMIARSRRCNRPGARRQPATPGDSVRAPCPESAVSALIGAALPALFGPPIGAEARTPARLLVRRRQGSPGSACRSGWPAERSRSRSQERLERGRRDASDLPTAVVYVCSRAAHSRRRRLAGARAKASPPAGARARDHVQRVHVDRSVSDRFISIGPHDACSPCTARRTSAPSSAPHAR
jgi:hypothetical protein